MTGCRAKQPAVTSDEKSGPPPRGRVMGRPRAGLAGESNREGRRRPPEAGRRTGRRDGCDRASLRAMDAKGVAVLAQQVEDAVRRPDSHPMTQGSVEFMKETGSPGLPCASFRPAPASPWPLVDLHGSHRSALLTIALDGILAGIAHVFSGSDQVAGVAPIAVDRPDRRIGTGRIGLRRGFGVAVLGLAEQMLFCAIFGCVTSRVGLAWLPRLLAATGPIAVAVGVWWCAATWAAAPFTPS